MPAFFDSKWGDPSFGSEGGVVTWSIIGPGVSEFGGDPFDAPPMTQDGDALTRFNEVALFRRAFASWAEISDISFVQVEDDGEVVGAGFGADIRISFVEIDGAFGSTLGRAFAPFNRPVTFAGDIEIDAAERGILTDPAAFLEVVAHEIGHTIGLEHVDDETALMFPTLRGDVDGPRQDDIIGARQIYGREDAAQEPLRMSDRAPDVSILEPIEGFRVIGTSASNDIRGTAARELFNGGAGHDLLVGRGGEDVLRGGQGDDTMRGGLGEDRLIGAGGQDALRGGGAADLLLGGAQADRLFGGSGDDDLRGGGGADRLVGGAGEDTLNGGGGADVFVAANGGPLDLIRGFRAGVDVLDFSRTGADAFSDLSVEAVAGGLAVTTAAGGGFLLGGLGIGDLSAADAVFITPEQAAGSAEEVGSEISGGPGDDVLTGTLGDDTILGLAGDDVLFGLDGDDFLDGGANPTPISVVFGAPLTSTAPSQQLFGGRGNDTLDNGLELFGGAGDDLLISGASPDSSLLGGAGNDTLVSVGDDHELIGGPGADVFVFSAEDPTRNANIVGFEADLDVIDLSAFPEIKGLSDLDAFGLGVIQVDFGAGDFELSATEAGVGIGDISFIFADLA